MPPAELARLHMRNAVVYVLSQPPVQGKAALARLISLVSSTYFPLSVTAAISQLESNGLRRPAESLVKAFIDHLVLGFSDITSPLANRQSTLLALEAAHTLFPAIAEARVGIQLNKVIRLVPDANLNLAADLVAESTRYTGELLDQASKDKLESFINTSPEVSTIALLSKVPSLKDRVLTRVNALDVEGIADIVSVAKTYDLIKPRALELLSQARQWEQVNTIVNTVVLPIFDTLLKDDILRIIRMPEETHADLRGSNGFVLLMGNVVRTGLMSSKELNPVLIENDFRPVALAPPT